MNMLSGATSRIPRRALAASAIAACAALLLALPPAPSYSSLDRTDGKISLGGLSVGVFASVEDAQLEKYSGPTGYGYYTPADLQPTTPTLGTNPGSLTKNDIAYIADPHVATQRTFYDSTLYVSNTPSAYNVLLITLDADGVTPDADGCASATVRTGRDSITAQLTPTAPDVNDNNMTYYQAFVRILDPRADLPEGTPDYVSSDGPACADYAAGVAEDAMASLLAAHGDSVSVAVSGKEPIPVEVDGEGPEIANIEPEDRSYVPARRLDLTFEVRDDDSGLRHDGELVITDDGDYRRVNPDDDHDTTDEPLSIGAGRQGFRPNGKAAHIDLKVWQSGDAADADDITDTGRWELLGDRPGAAYRFSADAGRMGQGRYFMEVRATDRTGNETVTNALPDDEEAAPYVFIVDDTEPRAMAAWTGIRYDSDKEREAVDREWVMVDFGEPLQRSADEDRFTVAGHRVVEVYQPNLAPPISRGGSIETDDSDRKMAFDINGEEIEDPRSRVYLRLAEAPAGDETPDLLFFGGAVYDLAGNPSDSGDIEIQDGIAPGFTVFVSAEDAENAEGRPVVNARGEFVVDVRADGEVRRRPVVYFIGLSAAEEQKDNKGTGDYLYSVRSVQTGAQLIAQDDDLHWRRTYPASGLSGLGDLLGVVVMGADDEDNTGATDGWTPETHRGASPPTSSDPIALQKMDDAGLLLEVDRAFNGGAAPELSVSPRRGQDASETESARPFVNIRFPKEAGEYAVCPSGGCGGDNPDAEFTDSHGEVQITDIELDGIDASERLTRVDDRQFALVAGNLAQGRHEVTYEAVDDAGNEIEGEFTFSVLARGAYEVTVAPGWNLISFPGTPSEPALEDIIPPGGRIPMLLSYQDGNWLTAALDEEGNWRGALTQFEAGYGYWAFAETYQTLAPLIAEPEQTAAPPTVRVRHGWNLLGVIDLFQNPAGSPPGPDGGGNGEADAYLASVPWRIAYTYDTQYSRWQRFTPEDDKKADDDDDGTEDDDEEDGEPPEIVNGKGYWVWSAEPGTLVP